MELRHAIFSKSCNILKYSGMGSLLAPITRGRGVILTLHSVRPKEITKRFAPNAHLEVSPEFFDQTLSYIRASGNEILSLSDALERAGDPTYNGPRFVALSFDDGFRNNLEYALPVLERHKAPFTIFPTTGFIDRTSELWWVALERIVAQSDFIEIPYGAKMVRMACGTLEEKKRTFCRVLSWLSADMSESAQRMEVRRMSKQIGLELEALADELILSWSELTRLAEHPLAEVGAHTHDHFALARLSMDEMRADVRKGQKRLDRELGLTPRYFAYPYGYEAAVDARCQKCVLDCGFSAAVTTRPGVMRNIGKMNRAALPRVSLNGHFQNQLIVEQCLNGTPFPFYYAARWARHMFTSVRYGERAPSTR